MSKNVKIILGSASSGRKQVLEKMGYTFDILVANIDEKSIRDKDPKKLTLKLAHAKADVLVKKIKEPAILITSDQVVNYIDTILEKPESEEEARKFLKNYALAPAQTVNGVVVTNTSTGERVEATDTVKVYFKIIPDEVINKLISEGNVFKQAGGFSIWDPLLKPYINRVEGEEESVMGLPAKLTKELLAKFNV